MVVENFPYISDPRVRNESRTLAANGYKVSVICPAKGREPWHEIAEGVSIYRFCHPKFGENRFISRLLFWLEKLSYRLADHVIIPNESYKEIALQRGGLPQSKLTVVRNGPQPKTMSTKDIDPELRRKASTIIAYAGVIAS